MLESDLVASHVLVARLETAAPRTLTGDIFRSRLRPARLTINSGSISAYCSTGCQEVYGTCASDNALARPLSTDGRCGGNTGKHVCIAPSEIAVLSTDTVDVPLLIVERVAVLLLVHTALRRLHLCPHLPLVLQLQDSPALLRLLQASS